VSEPCPICDAPTRDGLFCRACGYDAEQEHGDDAYLDGLDLPGQDGFDYDDALRREGLADDDAGAPDAGPAAWWLLAGVVVFFVVVALAILR